mmetsp:Transcript_5301/g.17213  ORF Transcript_5301/g.17213 Transcript_5301/m.17213 type:complete len:205 (-) Transcript_5301:223-837(-)
MAETSSHTLQPSELGVQRVRSRGSTGVSGTHSHTFLLSLHGETSVSSQAVLAKNVATPSPTARLSAPSVPSKKGDGSQKASPVKIETPLCISSGASGAGSPLFPSALETPSRTSSPSEHCKKGFRSQVASSRFGGAAGISSYTLPPSALDVHVSDSCGYHPLDFLQICDVSAIAAVHRQSADTEALVVGFLDMWIQQQESELCY